MSSGHQHSRCAEATLQAVFLNEALLDGIENAILLQILDGANAVAFGHGGEDGAALDRFLVHPHDTRSAVRRVAAPVCSGEAQRVPHEVDEQQPSLDSRVWSCPLTLTVTSISGLLSCGAAYCGRAATVG